MCACMHAQKHSISAMYSLCTTVPTGDAYTFAHRYVPPNYSSIGSCAHHNFPFENTRNDSE